MEDFKLDGNAAAGVLQEIFATEMTLSWTNCAHCGALGQVGELVAYVRAAGIVLRCRGCGAVQIRIVEGRDVWMVDMMGVRRLEIQAKDSA